jgi:hypothetical protein
MQYSSVISSRDKHLLFVGEERGEIEGALAPLSKIDFNFLAFPFFKKSW